MEKRIKNVMASVFNVEVSEINDDTSPDSLEHWDSLRHMHLITGLEEEFETTFTEDEIVEMLNYKLIYDTLKNKNL
ncbi:MAG TPA: acyl carrier protein [Bacteroidia bacterium]|jgi:acyl carrier protein|nr:acyl carrier protein [Bacteroidia bacterium]